MNSAYHRRTRVPSIRDETAWFRLLHGRDMPSAEERRMILEAFDESDKYESAHEDEVVQEGGTVLTGDVLVDYHKFHFQPPSLTMIAALDTEDILRLIYLIRKWMQQPIFTQTTKDADQIGAIYPLHSQWLFALLARLDQRLSGDEIAYLRALARTCISLIVQFRSDCARNATIPEESSLVHESGAWIIISIVAGVWGQQDLWTEAEQRLSL
ncbi:hypothetical protein MYAM1_003075 [Malassezia yamatoensis]|uniref:Uncharacterized protein n=1 Tax=Malassezia yamatoensis TaxID=253288 RepID=A0AAJ5YX36_9BASI|nr:hypothetical protein MYAM1_003075 [Malassezia yamatoensis]